MHGIERSGSPVAGVDKLELELAIIEVLTRTSPKRDTSRYGPPSVYQIANAFRRCR